LVEERPTRRRRTPEVLTRIGGSAWTYALLGILLITLWQWATVTVNYNGNWTALFCTGALSDAPQTLSSEHIYQFPGSSGYDGQMYHYIAHDPWMRNADLKAHLDDPRLRYRRILVPALAWAGALGRTEWIDAAYGEVCILFAGRGVFWSSIICLAEGAPVWWGLGFLLLPAVVIGVDRMIVDLALAALTVGFLVYVRRASGLALWFLLAAILLTRETGVLILAGCCASLLLERRWRSALWVLSSALPMIAWYAFVQLHTVSSPTNLSFVPLTAIRHAVLHPAAYPNSVPFQGGVRTFDYLALAGVLAAFALSIGAVMRRCLRPECMSALAFALLGIFLQRDDHWMHVYDFGRVYTPLLIFLAFQGLKAGWAGYVAPWAMIVPRIGIQIAPQVLAVGRAIHL
jgi:hypothetical protein